MKTKIKKIGILLILAISLVGCKKKDTGVLTTIGDNNVNNTDNKEKYNADATEVELVTTDGEVNNIEKKETEPEKKRELSLEKEWYNKDTRIMFKGDNFIWKDGDINRSGSYEYNNSSITLTYTKDISEYEGYEGIEDYYVDDDGNEVEEYFEDKETHSIVDEQGNKLHKFSRIKGFGNGELPTLEEVTTTFNVNNMTVDELILIDKSGKEIKLKTNE